MPSQTVVVVEDDPAIMAIAADTFLDADYAVVAFSNADDALAYMVERASGVAAIFTDLQMPGRMDGLILAEMVGRHWPAVTVILTSGRVRPMDDLPHNVRFVSKPWSPHQILEAVRAATAFRVDALLG